MFTTAGVITGVIGIGIVVGLYAARTRVYKMEYDCEKIYDEKGHFTGEYVKERHALKPKHIILALCFAWMPWVAFFWSFILVTVIFAEMSSTKQIKWPSRCENFLKNFWNKKLL